MTSDRSTASLAAIGAATALALTAIQRLGADTVVTLAVERTQRFGLEETVPLVMDHAGPVPALQLAIYMAFAAAVARIASAPLGRTLVAAIPASLCAQAVLLSSDVVHRAHSDPTFFDNRIYALYADLAVAAVLAGIAFGSGIVVRELWDARRSPPSAVRWLYGPCALVLGAVAIGPAPAAGLAMLVLVACAVVAGTLRRARAAAARLLAALAGPVRRDPRAVAFGAALLLFALTVAFNVALVRQLGAGFRLASDDGDFYDDLGWAMATNTQYRTFERIEHTWSFRSPGYPAFVAVVYALFGRNFVALGVAQAAAGALLPILVYALGRRAFDARVAAVASALTASSGLLVSVLATLRSEAVFAVVGAGLIWAMAESADGPAPRRTLAAALGGELFAFGVLVKPQLLVFAPLAALWWLYRAVPRDRPWAVVGRAAVAVVFAGVIAAPALLRDVAANGRPTIVGASHATETWYINYAGARLIPLGVTRPDVGLLIQAFERYPGEVTAILAQEVPYTIYLYFLGPWFGKGDPLQLQRFSGLAHALNGYTVAGGLLGLVLWRAWPRGAATRLLILAFIAANSVVVLAIAYPSVRYRIPFDPLLFLWVAAGIVSSARQVTAAHRALGTIADERGAQRPSTTMARAP